MLVDRTFGIHFHAFYRGAETLVGLQPVLVIQGEAPAWVQALVLEWVCGRQKEFQPSWNWAGAGFKCAMVSAEYEVRLSPIGGEA